MAARQGVGPAFPMYIWISVTRFKSVFTTLKMDNVRAI